MTTRTHLYVADDPTPDHDLPKTKTYRVRRRENLKRTPTPTAMRDQLALADEMCEELLARVVRMELTLSEFGLMHDPAPLPPTPATTWLAEGLYPTPTRDPGGTP